MTDEAALPNGDGGDSWPAGVRIVEVDGHRPEIHPEAWVAPGATLIGRVRIGAGASIYYGCVLRADRELIEVGAGTNVQDNTVMHADPGLPLRIGERVSVGHRALVHGCTVGDDVLVGMSSTLLNGARIGAGSLIAAGAVVLEGTEVPEGSLVAGVPGKVRRELTDDDRERVLQNARTYEEITELHRASTILN
ncbi:gamma carbonic anhydrase family protein [Sediminivirga luteola]|uniref:gamma carbonic anhydrase family protein n=1 Tax=Sediminivirga luteola TaxID=1774748 RepID=UPI001F593C46|nr:gamma carbonic anhydrase family protein [Sediminivirga luteola]MCI2265631.1 gamma carbonic anhydrase family protein [Sediminivirga luteola]